MASSCMFALHSCFNAALSRYRSRSLVQLPADRACICDVDEARFTRLLPEERQAPLRDAGDGPRFRVCGHSGS